MAIGAALMAVDYPPEHVRVDADCKLDQLSSGDPRIGQVSLTVSGRRTTTKFTFRAGISPFAVATPDFDRQPLSTPIADLSLTHFGTDVAS
jgi:hypothetical protein